MSQPAFLDVIPLPNFQDLRLAATGMRALERYNDLASGAQPLAKQPVESRIDIIDECLDLVESFEHPDDGFQLTGLSVADFWAALSKAAPEATIKHWHEALTTPAFEALRAAARQRIGRRPPQRWLQSDALWLPDAYMLVPESELPTALERLLRTANHEWKQTTRSYLMVEMTHEICEPDTAPSFPVSGQHWPEDRLDRSDLMDSQHPVGPWHKQRLRLRDQAGLFQEFQLGLPSLELSYFSDRFMVRNGFAVVRLCGFTDEQQRQVLVVDALESDWLRDLQRQAQGEPLPPARLTASYGGDEAPVEYSPQPIPDCPLAMLWVALVAEAVARVAYSQVFDLVAWVPAALQADLDPDTPADDLARIYDEQLPAALSQALRGFDTEREKSVSAEVSYPTYARDLRIVCDHPDGIMLIDRTGRPVHGPFPDMNAAVDH